MRKRRFSLYFLAVTLPVFLALIVWQSNRYQDLSKETIRLEQTQIEWIESNKRLIAGITEYSSPERIEFIAVNQLGLKKIRPENLLQVKIIEGKRNEF
jgi:cell division protein FtsL